MSSQLKKAYLCLALFAILLALILPAFVSTVPEAGEPEPATEAGGGHEHAPGGEPPAIQDEPASHQGAQGMDQSPEPNAGLPELVDSDDKAGIPDTGHNAEEQTDTEPVDVGGLMQHGTTHAMEQEELHADGDDHGSLAAPVPIPLDTYDDADAGLLSQLLGRIKHEPYNLIASLIFLLAIIHTFFAGSIRRIAHKVQHEHEERIRREGRTGEAKPYNEARDDVSFKAEILHYCGEIEAIFGIWLIPLLLSFMLYFGFQQEGTHQFFEQLSAIFSDPMGFLGSFIFLWDSFIQTFHSLEAFFETVSYTEPLFVVVIMTLASTRPVLKFAENTLRKVAFLGGGRPSAWWLSILIIGPLLGSFITEPAAMTIAALLLGTQFYRFNPGRKLKYATLGLLFVNISVGGTLTHFAAPPVLMVAATWDWDIVHMFLNFGWKAILGICVATGIYYWVFKRELAEIDRAAGATTSEGRQGPLHWMEREDPIPSWVTAGHLAFIAWTVMTLHYPALFLGGFLFFLAFAQATSHHQNEISLKGPLLVGFFLAGLVTHGSLQGWWIAPVLGSLGELPLFTGATVLTAFNDNAAITFLASQVPAFDATTAADSAKAVGMQYAVVAGAVTGGGLTVIANAPNPAGQSILQRHFGANGISPANLALSAIIPTIVMGFCFMLLR